MPFTLFTDSFSNLPGEILTRLSIRAIPCSYLIEGEQVFYDGDIEHFDAHEYYDRLRRGDRVTTSLLNPQIFLEHFRPELEAGNDVVYVGISSGISGTFQSSRLAAGQLAEEFPLRKLRMVDSLGAGLGTGLLTCMAADLRDASHSAEEAADILERERMNLCEFFTVDDLNFLKRTGRISNTTAMLGSVLNIKPILRGDEQGHIVSCAKPRGRQKAIDTLVDYYRTRAVDPENRRVAICHGDCPEEAQKLAQRICAIAKPGELILCPHEPFTGAHVGPGMLGIFFFAKGR